jgi:hypothetical protein
MQTGRLLLLAMEKLAGCLRRMADSGRYAPYTAAPVAGRETSSYGPRTQAMDTYFPQHRHTIVNEGSSSGADRT